MHDTACREIGRELDRDPLAFWSLEAIASSALRHIRQLVPCQQANVIVFDPESHALSILATDGTKNGSVGKLAHLPLEGVIWGDDLDEGRIAPEFGPDKFYSIEDIAAIAQPSRVLQRLQALGLRSYLNVPLVAPFESGRAREIAPLGCLTLAADTPGAFTSEHVNRASEVANLLAYTLGQANLCEQMQRHVNVVENRLAETTNVETELISSVQTANERLLKEMAARALAENRLQQQTDRSRVLSTISQQIRLSSSLKEIFNFTVVEVQQLLQTDRVAIVQALPEACVSAIAESVAPGWPSMLELTMRDRCISQQNYLQQCNPGGIQAIEDIYTDGLNPDGIQLLEFFNIKSLLVVPLLQQNKLGNSDESKGAPQSSLWGLLSVHQCSKTRQWQPDEIDWLKSIATLLENAIEQFRLREVLQQLEASLASQVTERTAQLQQEIEFDALLKRITDKVRDSVNESQILQTALQELAIVLEVEDCNSAAYSDDLTTSTIGYECKGGFIDIASVARIFSENPPQQLSAQGEVVQMASFPEIYTQLLQGQSFQFCELNSDARRHQRAILACPIFNSSGTIGDLWLFKSQEEIFNEREVRLVQRVARECAIAIRQARLYQSSLTQVEELAKLNILKDDFLSTVSHELRTPLANMKMAIQMLAIALNQETGFFVEFAKPEAERNKVARYFQIVRNECEREIRLIEDLLELQRLDAGSGRWAPAIVDLQRVVPQIVQPFQEQVRKYRQTLVLDMDSAQPFLVGDPFILERILGELLTNACKYTPSGEQITVKVRAVGERLHLSVTNSGVEIPPEELTRIFNKFYRIPKADRWQQGGAGLGLAVVQKLTERLGGTIQVKSADGLTCFALELPLKKPSQD